MKTLGRLLWVCKVIVFFVLPLALLLSVALWWGFIRGLALSGVIVVTTYFVACVLRSELPQDEESEDDGDGGEPDEDEVPPPEARLLFEVNQPERDEWRN